MPHPTPPHPSRSIKVMTQVQAKVNMPHPTPPHLNQDKNRKMSFHTQAARHGASNNKQLIYFMVDCPKFTDSHPLQTVDKSAPVWREASKMPKTLCSLCGIAMVSQRWSWWELSAVRRKIRISVFFHPTNMVRPKNTPSEMAGIGWYNHPPFLCVL